MHKPKVKTTKLCCTAATTDGFQQLGASFFYIRQYTAQTTKQNLKVRTYRCTKNYSKMMGYWKYRSRKCSM